MAWETRREAAARERAEAAERRRKLEKAANPFRKKGMTERNEAVARARAAKSALTEKQVAEFERQQAAMSREAGKSMVGHDLSPDERKGLMHARGLSVGGRGPGSGRR